MTKIKVGVLRGGPSSEYDVSLKSGGEVLRHLPEAYQGFDVLISREGDWHFNGFPKKPGEIFKSVDVVFNALHGEYGEDGKVQQVFEAFNVPYTGSRIIPSSLSMKKHMAKDVFARAGLKTPRGLYFKGDDFYGLDVRECAVKVFNSLSPSWVVKPASLGSSVGVSICHCYSELEESISEAARHDHEIIVEEFIAGREATCGVLESFRGKNHYPLPVVEIIPPEGNFFDYEVKYNGRTKEICPAGFDTDVKRQLEQAAIKAHEALGCRHYSRSDFIVSPKGIYILETNTLPGLTPQSLLPVSAGAAGISFEGLLDHLLKLALSAK